MADLAQGLGARGYSVQVVTGQPGYSSRGRLASGEVINGVRVHRLPKIQLARKNAAGRILSAVSFFAAAFFKLLSMDRQALLIIGSDPPFLGLLGWFFKIFRRQPYVLIVSDAYPEIAVALREISPGGIVTRLLEGTNRLVYPKAEKIVVLGERMQAKLREKYFPREDGRKVQIIHNWADGDRIRPLAKSSNPFCRKHDLLKPLVLLFSGNLGKIYNFRDMLKLASLLRDEPAIRFLLIGGGPLRGFIEEEAMRRGLKNIHRMAYQPDEELPFSLTSGDLAFLPLKGEAVGFCVPGKIYPALAAGLPLFVMAPEESEPARIVLENDCGWVFSEDQCEEAGNLLKEIARDPSLLDRKKSKARACYEAKFQREKAINAYDQICSGR